MNWWRKIVSIKRGILVIGSQSVNKQSWHFHDISKSVFFKINILIGDQEVSERGRRDDLKCVWTRLWCCLSKGTLKRHFLDTYLSASLRVLNFWNTLAMRVNFFLKMFKIWCWFQNCRKKSGKILSL